MSRGKVQRARRVVSRKKRIVRVNKVRRKGQNEVGTTLRRDQRMDA